MLKIGLIAVGVVIVLLVMFIAWRWTSVGRGMRQRDARPGRADEGQSRALFRNPGAFSRVGDIDGKVKPSELVDWYVGMLRQKGMIT